MRENALSENIRRAAWMALVAAPLGQFAIKYMEMALAFTLRILTFCLFLDTGRVHFGGVCWGRFCCCGSMGFVNHAMKFWMLSV